MNEFFESSVTKIADLVKLSPNETDTRVQALKILKTFLREAVMSHNALSIMDVRDDEDFPVGGTD